MQRRRKSRLAATAVLVLLAGYLLASYLVAPEFWTFRDWGHPVGPMLTTTPQGIPGDPVNVGLVGPRESLLRAFAAADWHPADAITLRSSIEIGLSVILDRPYADAPVSTLLYEGRRQDLAFEKPVGDSADQRHHVRLWQAGNDGPDGRTLWLGAVSFDRGVGLSHDTGEITHHIGPDLDAARDLLIGNLTNAGWILSTYGIEGSGPTETGRNGGGDPYVTDGMATIGVLRSAP